MRAKNILGVSSCRYTRLYGQISEDNQDGNRPPDHLAVMPSYENGIHAAIDLLTEQYLKLGFFIPLVLCGRWSGDKTNQYAKGVSSIMKVSPYLPLPFRSYGDSLMRAMAIMENGDPARSIPPGYFGQFINEEF